MGEIHEDDHGLDNIGEFDEPVGGWVSSPQLIDTELLTTLLCRFTGAALSQDQICLARSLGRHVDEECVALYVQVAALRDGRVDLSGFGDELPEEVRLPIGGGEPTGSPHA